MQHALMQAARHWERIETVAESFGDLDADYQPVGFWDRLRGAKPSRASNPTKPTKPTKK